MAFPIVSSDPCRVGDPAPAVPKHDRAAAIFARGKGPSNVNNSADDLGADSEDACVGIDRWPLGTAQLFTRRPSAGNPSAAAMHHALHDEAVPWRGAFFPGLAGLREVALLLYVSMSSALAMDHALFFAGASCGSFLCCRLPCAGARAPLSRLLLSAAIRSMTVLPLAGLSSRIVWRPACPFLLLLRDQVAECVYVAVRNSLASNPLAFFSINVLARSSKRGRAWRPRCPGNSLPPCALVGVAKRLEHHPAPARFSETTYSWPRIAQWPMPTFSLCEKRFADHDERFLGEVGAGTTYRLCRNRSGRCRHNRRIGSARASALSSLTFSISSGRAGQIRPSRLHSLSRFHRDRRGDAGHDFSYLTPGPRARGSGERHSICRLGAG